MSVIEEIRAQMRDANINNYLATGISLGPGQLYELTVWVRNQSYTDYDQGSQVKGVYGVPITPVSREGVILVHYEWDGTHEVMKNWSTFMWSGADDLSGVSV